MKIYHKNKLFVNAKECKTEFSRMKGLMFSKIKPILIINKKEYLTPIHTFFVFRSIDAIWIDKNKTIVDIKRNIKPFTPLIIPKEKSMYILELKNKFSKNLNMGDKLGF